MEEQVLQIRTLLAEGELLEIEDVLSGVKEWNRELLVMNIMDHVFHREIGDDVWPTVFDYSVDLDELVRHFIRLKLYMRRLEFDLPDELQNELYVYCRETGVSDHLLLYILLQNVFFQKKVCQKLSDLFVRAEGKDSPRGKLYRGLAEKIAQ